MTLQVRCVTADDHAAWMALWQGYQRFYMADIGDDVSAVAWQRFLDPNEPMNAALAWQGDTAVGMVNWLFHRSTWTINDYCYLQDLFVDREQRSLGVGRKLVEFVYQQARDADCARVYWLTHETNATAILLYERLAERSGFIQYRKML